MIVAHLSELLLYPVSEQEAKELPCFHPKHTFIWFSFKLYLSIVLNSSSKSTMCCSFSSEVMTMSSTYACTFRPIIGARILSINSTSILETERHDLVAVAKELDHEGGLALISGMHADLIVP